MKKFNVILVIIVIIVAAVIILKPDGNKIGDGGSSYGLPDRPVRVGIVTWGGYAGGIMANNGFSPNKNCDFYRNHGIEVDLQVIDDFVMSRSAFKAGGDKDGIDIVWATVDAYALEYPALRDLNPKCILQYDWSRGGDAIAVDGRKIKTAKDLKDKSISVAEDTPSHYFALFVLDEAGLGLRDVRWSFVNSAIDAANVFKAGNVDATVSWSPDVYIAARERAGGKILMSTREATNLIADIFVARGDFIEKYPKAVEAFVKGWLEGVDKVHQNPQPVIRLMADGFNLPMEDSEAMLGDVHLPNAADNVAFFNPYDPTGYDAIFDKSSRLWKKLGKIDAEVGRDYMVKETRETRFLVTVASSFSPDRADPIVVDPTYVKGKGKDEIITKEVSINFPSGSAELSAEAREIIRKDVAPFVQTYGGCFISLEGNTDNVGGYDYNKNLSLRRAASVRDFLISEYDLPSSRFEAKGNAWDKPVDSNATEAGRARNRRTDIVVSSGQ
ncbi:OmpA family protein [bacterium]|nr:OmpA family protein [bacterium]